MPNLKASDALLWQLDHDASGCLSFLLLPGALLTFWRLKSHGSSLKTNGLHGTIGHIQHLLTLAICSVSVSLPSFQDSLQQQTMQAISQLATRTYPVRCRRAPLWDSASSCSSAPVCAICLEEFSEGQVRSELTPRPAGAAVRTHWLGQSWFYTVWARVAV